VLDYLVVDAAGIFALGVSFKICTLLGSFIPPAEWAWALLAAVS
tara:strand:+ start:1017 stop:1148 length:132 start_codon:yes stop_codon:yes gene_type:complete